MSCKATAVCPGCKQLKENVLFYTRICCPDKPRASICNTCYLEKCDTNQDKQCFCMFCLKNTYRSSDQHCDLISVTANDMDVTCTELFGVFHIYMWQNSIFSKLEFVEYLKPILCKVNASASNITVQHKALLNEHNSLKERNRQLTALTESLTKRYYATVNQNTVLLKQISDVNERFNTMEASQQSNMLALNERLKVLETLDTSQQQQDQKQHQQKQRGKNSQALKKKKRKELIKQMFKRVVIKRDQ